MMEIYVLVSVTKEGVFPEGGAPSCDEGRRRSEVSKKRSNLSDWDKGLQS